jgi:putative thiamine transport system permease protein
LSGPLRVPEASLPLRSGRAAARAAVVALYVAPLLLALPWALWEGASAAGWRALFDDPQTPQALAATLFSALASCTIALAITLIVITALHGSRWWPRLALWMSPLLAVPHAAFAIGLAWLIAPAGWAARALAPLMGWAAPPPWVSVNDPYALALVAVLVFKEVPFLLWSALALLARPEAAATLKAQLAVARTLGYPARSLWWRVAWLWWLPRLAWPTLAVLAYALTVVDLALIIGPGSPPTLAVLAWQGLADGSVQHNQQGAATALALALLLALLAGAAWLAWRGAEPLWRRRATQGDRPAWRAPAQGQRLGALCLLGLSLVYAAVLLALGVLSLAGVWSFPALWPPAPSIDAWGQVHDSAGTVGFTALLALLAAAGAVVLVVAWLEAVPARWDARSAPFVLAPLVLPQLLLMVGLYRGALALQLDGTVAGLLWVHVLVVLPYVYTALAPAWRSFDVRYEWTALALGRCRLAFWWRVKWPLLAAPLASALAIGFAVSVAQYLATQFIGAGRHATLTTEAVTLASGGQRNLAAAFALLQALLPLLGFALAQRLARSSAAATR